MNQRLVKFIDRQSTELLEAQTVIKRALLYPLQPDHGPKVSLHHLPPFQVIVCVVAQLCVAIYFVVGHCVVLCCVVMCCVLCALWVGLPALTGTKVLVEKSYKICSTKNV